MSKLKEAYSLFRIYWAINKSLITALNLTLDNLRITK